MATVAPTCLKITAQDGSVLSRVWESLNSTDTEGDGVDLSTFDSISVQITGTPGTATGHMQGTIDGTTWVSLTDYQGTVVSGTSGIFNISETVWKIRPQVTGANGSTDLDFHLLAHKITSLRT